MTDDEFKKMKRLAGVPTDDERDDAKFDAERHITALIKAAFEKIDLEINYSSYAIVYEHDTREATVRLEESEFKLSHLIQLNATGLAKDYTITHLGGDLTVEFIVNAELDNAEFNR